MTSRPALLTRRPDRGRPETTVQLSPLAATDSDALAGALLRRIDPLPPQLTELFVGRADGNPYDMEELVRRRIDDGVIAVGEPHWTVQVENPLVCRHHAPGHVAAAHGSVQTESVDVGAQRLPGLSLLWAWCPEASTPSGQHAGRKRCGKCTPRPAVA